MEAGNWEELDFLLKSAGVPIEKAMGLVGSDSDDDESGLLKGVFITSYKYICS